MRGRRPRRVEMRGEAGPPGPRERRAQSERRGRERSPSQGSHSSSGSQTAQLAAAIMMLAETNKSNKTMDVKLLEAMERLAKATGETKKRKKEDEWKSQEKEVFKASVDIEDDSHLKLCWEVRGRLQNPNGKPDKWWTEEVPIKTSPALGANLVMGHLMPGRIHETTAVKLADRKEVLELKSFLTKNSGHLGAVRQKLRTEYNTGGSVSTSIETDFKAASDVREAVEGVLNLAAYLHMIRPFDYTGLGMLRAGHQITWFAGVARNGQEQARLIERWVNEVLVTAAQRGRQGLPPPVFEDMTGAAKQVCQAANLPESGLIAGETLGGARPGQEENLGKIQNLQAQVKAIERKLESGRRKGDREDRGRDDRGRDERRRRHLSPRTTEEKLRITCSKWNTEGEGCERETNCTLKHQCNKVLRQGFVCWANHKAYEHK